MTAKAGARSMPVGGVPTHRVPPWLPNAITGFRVVLLGVFLLAMGFDPRTAMPPAGDRGILALVSLLAIGGSDVLDGYLARRFDLTTRVGVILDAAADKIAQLGITAYFVFFTPLIPGWFMALLVARDVVIGGGTWAVARAAPGMPLRHRAHGKAASFVMFALFVWTLMGADEGVRRLLILTVSGFVVVSTLAYAVEGVVAWRDRRQWDDRLRRPKVDR